MFLIITILFFLIKTNFLYLVDVNKLPFLQISSIRINAGDILSIIIIIWGGLLLLKRKDKPDFIIPFLLLFFVSITSVYYSFIHFHMALDELIGGYRFIFNYFVYFGFAGLVNSNKRIKSFLSVILIVSIFSFGINIYEFLSQSRVVFSTSTPGFYSSIIQISIGDSNLAYLYNRAPFFLFFCLSISFANVLLKRRELIWKFVLFFSCICLVISMVRLWIIYSIALCVVVFLLICFLQRKFAASRITRVVAVIVIFSMVVFILINFFPEHFYFLNRYLSIKDYANESSFFVRVNTWKTILLLSRDSQLFGFGPGSNRYFEQQLGVYFTDVGLPNTLIQFGILGTASIFYLVLRILQALFKGLKQASNYQPIFIGLIGFMIMAIISYGFSIDYFTSMPWNLAILSVMVISNSMTKCQFHNHRMQKQK